MAETDSEPDKTFYTRDDLVREALYGQISSILRLLYTEEEDGRNRAVVLETIAHTMALLGLIPTGQRAGAEQDQEGEPDQGED